MWTLNNPTREDSYYVDYLSSHPGIKYFVFQRERGDQEGTIHLQG